MPTHNELGSSAIGINALSILDLQSWSRMILAKQKYQQLLDRRTKAATLIQSHVRKFLTKKLVEKLNMKRLRLFCRKIGDHLVPEKNSLSIKMESSFYNHLFEDF